MTLLNAPAYDDSSVLEKVEVAGAAAQDVVCYRNKRRIWGVVEPRRLCTCLGWRSQMPERSSGMRSAACLPKDDESNYERRQGLGTNIVQPNLGTLVSVMLSTC